MAKKCWEEIPKHYPYVEIDSFVIMPNHIHGIIVIDNNRIQNDRAQNIVPLQNEYQKLFMDLQDQLFAGIKAKGGQVRPIDTFQCGLVQFCQQFGTAPSDLAVGAQYFVP